MDTGKLLKVIDDIRREESDSNIQATLSNLRAYYVQPDPNSLNTEKQKIQQAVTTSKLSLYSLSDYKILEHLNVATLFGPGLYQRMNEALSSQAHEVSQRLKQLVTERNEALSSLERLQSNLRSFNFKSRALDDHHYEIGFILPDSYSELGKTEKALKDLRLFLEAIANATGNQQPLQIKYVSSGSVELFLDASAELAEVFGTVLEYVLNIYAAIKLYEGYKEGRASFSKKRSEKLEKLAEEEKVEKTEALLNEMLTKLGLSDPDTVNRVSKLFKTLLHHIEKGVSAEVVTPELAAPEQPTEDAESDTKQRYQEQLAQYDKKKEIDDKNRQIFILQQNNFYGMDTKFLANDKQENSADSPDN